MKLALPQQNNINAQFDMQLCAHTSRSALVSLNLPLQTKLLPRSRGTVKGTAYSKGYIMSEDFVRNVQTNEIDPLFKQAERDVDSVLWAVYSHTCS
jgi:hypothetical protein